MATLADHITPHRGDWNEFRLGAIQSLCASCHKGPKDHLERYGFSAEVGEDGKPLDPNHPAYRTAERWAKG
jgi:5-methylcytosine-specific restriction protein A